MSIAITNKLILATSLKSKCSCFECMNLYLDCIEIMFPELEFDYSDYFPQKAEALFQKYSIIRTCNVTPEDIIHANKIMDLVYQAMVMYYISTDNELY